jgi:pyruvate formate lyase activating enzyme
MKNTAILAKENNLLNIMVSNGFMSLFVLDELKDLIDAANIDLKSFNPDFYKKICNGNLKSVLKNLIEMKKRGIFVEVTTLLITDLNDSKEEINEIAGFIKYELGEDTPWHISRFYPTFKMTDKNQTDISSIHRAIEIGEKKGLKYIYSGNIPGDDKESTYCFDCKKILIERKGYCVIENRIHNGKCPYCGETINGIF